MKLPNLVGQRLDQGLLAIKAEFGSLNIVIDEYTIPSDFHKKVNTTGVKRIIRQKVTSNNGLELVVSTFNESPRSMD